MGGGADVSTGNSKMERAALLAQANASRDAADWTRAHMLYAEVLARNPTRSEIWVQYGHSLKESARYEEAKKAYMEALALAVESDTYLQLGHLFKLVGQRSEAAEMYAAAVALDPENADAAIELRAIGGSPEAPGLAASSHRSSSGGVDILIDITDLLTFFSGSRVPTGIQRVVMELGAALLAISGGKYSARLCALDEHDSEWKLFGASDFRRLRDLSIHGSSISDGSWVQACNEATQRFRERPRLQFESGWILISLGAPWSIPGYMAQVRTLRRANQVRYVGYVHDLVPALMPELCDHGTERHFLRWLYSLPYSADLMLANSLSTKHDYDRVMSASFEVYPPCLSIPLNGGFPEPLAGQSVDVPTIDVPFILTVGTIEPRKDHYFLLECWRDLVERNPDRLPLLVLAGRKGWGSERVTTMLRTAPLREKVAHFENLSDEGLRGLYRRCLFTIYNSRYEGWGLPVTESISFGKIPVVPMHSGLTEAGGKAARFFEHGSKASFIGVVEELLSEFHRTGAVPPVIAGAVEPWKVIGERVAHGVAEFFAGPEHPSEECEPLVQAGEIIELGSYSEDSREFARKEALLGEGWRSRESWGAPFASAAATIFLGIRGTDRGRYLYLCFTGDRRDDYVVTVSVGGGRGEQILVPARRTCIHRIQFNRPFGYRDRATDVQLFLKPSVISESVPAWRGGPQLQAKATIGLAFLMVCEESMVESRMRFVEAALSGLRIDKAAFG